ncbi:co-chaperone p23 (P23) [Plasmodium ovale curtisi]|uniref:Co-chaperone p23 (P23) n=1 Tax=Plasmodium ovale curtisi TaxID=864141 RepID=A0A1A8VR84_PLAOA|nr:co-chaperone p23 (P23) [Plasmodium ovale curtisi]
MHRFNGPSALKVKDEEIISKKNNFSFSAYSNDSNSITKKYIVNLTLLHDVIESETKYSFASVGKVVVTLKKEKKKIWNRLLLSKEKNPNMQVWWDMKEKYDDSVQNFLKDEEKKEKIEKTEKKEKDNGINQIGGSVPNGEKDTNENKEDKVYDKKKNSNEHKDAKNENSEKREKSEEL